MTPKLSQNQKLELKKIKKFKVVQLDEESQEQSLNQTQAPKSQKWPQN